MHKKPLLIFREPRVDTILRRRLETAGYQVVPKVRLNDAVGKDPGDHLSDREFDYLTRAHLDFLVVRNNEPVFAVEFDGAGHVADKVTSERDVIKNRLCKEAGLPLLRITSTEIDEHDQVSVLDYMLMRYVAWQVEYPRIMKEIEEYASTIGPDADPDNLAVDLDPSFHFGLRHPFPARVVVIERLWRRHRIAWSMWKPERHTAASMLCDVSFESSGPAEREEFHRCTRRAAAWRPGPKEQPAAFSESVSVSLRSWLPLRDDVPGPELLELLWGLFGGSPTEARAREIVEQFNVRATSMWFPDLPGINAWDIAEKFAEYLGFRAIERWASKAHRRAD